MSTVGRLGILGGTFDPIHFGHFDAAQAARDAFSLDAIMLLPSGEPPHRAKGTHASAYHRFAMVSLAAVTWQGYTVSDIEVARNGPSYTADTLAQLRSSGWRASQLFFIIGTDAFAEIATWHAFPRVLDLAHFVIVARPGTTIVQATGRAPELRPRVRTSADGTSADDGATRIFLMEARTRDISSTAVRERIAAGHAVEDLIPPLVERHIAAHGLYRR